MKILQVCSKTPFPPKDGGSIAMNILTDGLLQCGNQVHVLSVSTAKHFVDESSMDKSYKKKTKYQSVFIDTAIKPLDAFFNLFTNKSYNIVRFYSAEFEKVLVEKLKSENYDIVHLETLWVVPYLDAIRKNSKAKIVLRSQNVEYLIWERLTNDCKNPIKKWYLKLLAKRLKKYEFDTLNSFDGIAAITDVDANQYKKMGAKIPIIHIPFGIDLKKYVADTSNVEYPSVFHLGAMDWLPNVDGIKWFLTDVWPKVYDKHPNVKLYLAGRGMPQWLLDLKTAGVVIVGEVANAQKFINSKSVMVVPLSSGGGMRVKIIEGMALAKTIVTTSIGCEGINCENNRNILIANTANEFVDAIHQCVSDKNRCETIGNNAQKLISEKYDNFVICTKLTKFYKSLL